MFEFLIGDRAARFGKGDSMIFFAYRATPCFREWKAEYVTIRTSKGRAGIAHILRQYRRAQRYCREHNDEIQFKTHSYRWLALRNATAFIFTLTKDGHAYQKSYEFSYHVAGFLGSVSKEYCIKNFGYQYFADRREKQWTSKE